MGPFYRYNGNVFNSRTLEYSLPLWNCPKIYQIIPNFCLFIKNVYRPETKNLPKKGFVIEERALFFCNSPRFLIMSNFRVFRLRVNQGRKRKGEDLFSQYKARFLKNFFPEVSVLNRNSKIPFFLVRVFSSKKGINPSHIFYNTHFGVDTSCFYAYINSGKGFSWNVSFPHFVRIFLTEIFFSRGKNKTRIINRMPFKSPTSTHQPLKKF